MRGLDLSMRCLCCKGINSIGLLIMIDPQRILRAPYTGIYPICNKCQNNAIKPLEILQNIAKGIDDYAERKEEFTRIRSLCRKCFKELNQDRWILIFTDKNFIKNTSYVDPSCAKEIQLMLNIIENGKKQYELFG